MTISHRIRVVIFGLACAGVAWLSLVPQEELPPTGVSDKIEHFIAYAGLALIGAWAWRPRLALALVLIAFGVGIEVLQTTMALGRHGDVIDALANSLGVVLGLAMALALGKRRR